MLSWSCLFVCCDYLTKMWKNLSLYHKWLCMIYWHQHRWLWQWWKGKDTLKTDLWAFHPTVHLCLLYRMTSGFKVQVRWTNVSYPKFNNIIFIALINSRSMEKCNILWYLVVFIFELKINLRKHINPIRVIKDKWVNLSIDFKDNILWNSIPLINLGRSYMCLWLSLY